MFSDFSRNMKLTFEQLPQFVSKYPLWVTFQIGLFVYAIYAENYNNDPQKLRMETAIHNNIDGSEPDGENLTISDQGYSLETILMKDSDASSGVTGVNFLDGQTDTPNDHLFDFNLYDDLSFTTDQSPSDIDDMDDSWIENVPSQTPQLSSKKVDKNFLNLGSHSSVPNLTQSKYNSLETQTIKKNSETLKGKVNITNLSGYNMTGSNNVSRYISTDDTVRETNTVAATNGETQIPLSKHVSKLLDTLMLGYDKRLRPLFGGSPLVVKAHIEIRSMGPISERDMIYSMDCYFRQTWTDRRLAFNATVERVTNVSLNVKMLERIWHPDTIFINGGPSYVHTITTPNKFFRLSHDGTIIYSQRLTVKASCPMRLEKFPMDTQQCPLHIASFGYPVTDVIYEWRYGNERAAVAATDMRLSQFDLKGMPACNDTRYFKGTQHSVLTIYFDFRRHTGFFLIQVYVPCCLLVVLSWVSFWINREATSDRISLGATTMLTMTFLNLDSRNDLPKVAYTTALDVYIAMCFFFVFASILQFAGVHFFTKYGTAEGENMAIMSDDDDDDDEDDEGVDGLESCDLDEESADNSNGITRCIRKLWRCIMSTRSKRFNKNVRNAMGLNSVSKIDKVSRVLFPAAFSGLNIVYWMSYL